MSEAASTGWVGDSRTAIRLVTAAEAVGSGPSIEAGLQFRLKPGWHTYWRSPGDAGIAPKVDWTGSENLKAVAIAWPAPKRHTTAGLRSNVYDRDVTLPLTVIVDRPGAPVRLRATVDFAGCAEICIPYHAELQLDLPAGVAEASQEAPAIADGRSRVPSDLASREIEVVLSKRSATPAGSLISVLLRSQAQPFREPELFAEQAGEDDPAGSIRVADEGRTAWLRIAIPRPQVKTSGAVTLTLVDGARSVEFLAPPASAQE
jgi:suppressor for copper-sensitivity B